MKAAILHGKEQVKVEDIDPPRLARGEVRVRVEAALTCGTDLKVFKRGYHARMIVPPSVFGHEWSGVITETARGVTTWKTGDRVVGANSAPCGKCFFCKNEQENLCDDLLFLNGAYAESLVIPERLVRKNLLRLNKNTPFADAALVEPLACVVLGVQETGLRAGMRLLVLGAGPIGLMFVAVARHLGCHVTVAGRGAKRLTAAKALGADSVIDVGLGDDLTSAVKTQQPFDAVIEAIGKPQTWEAAVKLVRKGGVVNFFGGCPKGTTICLDTGLLHYSNLLLRASFHHTPATIRRALEYIEAGVVTARDFVDGQCSLDELPELLRSMAQGNRSVKTLVRMH